MPVALDAVLYYNSLMLPDCRIRDISADGAFVLTGGAALPDQAQIDLAISVAAGTGLSQRFTAQVVRTTESGIGVRLGSMNPLALRSLVETLYAA